MRLKAIFLSTTAILLATSALGADLPTHKSPPPPVPTLAAAPYSWTGFYVGVGGGFAYMNAKDRSSSYITTSSAASGSNRSDLSKWGAFGTVEAGYDYQMNRFVVGAFTNFDLRNLKASKSTIGTTSAPSETAFHRVWYKVGNSWDAGVRLGYLVNDRNLLYALGGYSGAQISSGARLDVYSLGGTYLGSSVTASESGWKSGWMLGAGWEDAITDHVSLKLEYRYADYGKAKSSYTTGSSGAQQSGDVSVQSVRAVLDYKF